MKKFLIAFCIGFSCSLFAAPYVTNVVAKQRFPWGIVDISCDVQGIDEKIKGLEFTIDAVLADSGEVKRVSNVCFRGEKNSASSGSLAAPTNGNYRFVWYANKELDAARYKNVTLRVIIRETMVQLWEGGPYWALRNIGAAEPWDYGYYFWWGDTIGYRREDSAWVASDGSSSKYEFFSDNILTHNKDISTLRSEGWITEDGVLALEYDAAYVQWGSSWRMPTKAEFDRLVGECSWVWTTMKGIKGYVVRGKDDFSSASIFLPAAGHALYSSLHDAGLYGYYWSSVPCSDNEDAWYLNSNPGIFTESYSSGNKRRYWGLPVRAVQGSDK